MKKNGFTLIELMVVIAIIAIIASIGLATYSNAQKVGRDGKRKQDLENLRQSLIIYKNANNARPYPEDLSGLDSSYINPMPTDPTTGSNYRYQGTPTGGDTSYYICATLENPDASASHPDCTGTENYEVTPPQ